MFTGIVEEIGKVTAASNREVSVTALRALSGLQTGASVAVNGVCLTVTATTPNTFTVNVMPETLRRTNLGQLQTGDRVNLERALMLGGELGGHFVQGHIDDTGEITNITTEENARLLHITASPEVMRLIVLKGFIAVDGVSLTVAGRDDRTFWVSLVDFTQRNTTLGEKHPGDRVNLEADIIAKYVAQFQQTAGGNITFEFLQEHGFMVN
ncbi:MAG: riboflavin synthase [Chloroflexota bacterium]